MLSRAGAGLCAAAMGIVAASLMAVAATLPSQPAASTGKQSDNLAAAVLAVFENKCSQCHGHGGDKPPGGIGYITDLAKMARSDAVAPGKPPDSLLFKMVSSRAMPPARARNGSLSDGEIETIRQWIAAGAPTGAATASPTTQPASQPPGGGAASLGVGREAGGNREAGGGAANWMGRVGRFHLQLVHFPIALLLAALLAEILYRVKPTPERRWCARFCLWTGAIGAVLAAATGWLLSLSRDWSPQEEELLDPHEALGTAAACLAVGMIVLGWVLLRRGGKAAWLYFAGVLCLGVVVSLAGHFGGLLAWGKDFFAW